MVPDPASPDLAEQLTSRAFQITVDGGRETFNALGIEGASETEWLISDTVCALENMR